VIAILGTCDFFDKGCLAGQLVRMSSAAAMCESSVVRLEKAAAIAVIHIEQALSELFLDYLLSRNIRNEDDWWLLRLANFGKDGKPEAVIPKMSRERWRRFLAPRAPVSASS
jgi:CRP/FNR family transcriptional regulator, cyclic AMP receptor protein